MSSSSLSPAPACALASSSIAAWRVLLRGAGVFIALLVFCFWAAKGYHQGWTQNQVRIDQLDEVTGIVYPAYVPGFVPGVDFLAVGIGGGMVIFAVTFIRRRSPKGHA